MKISSNFALLIIAISFCSFRVSNTRNLETANYRLSRAIIIYSGNCKLYRRDFVKPNKVNWVSISQGFAKVVIDKSAKKFTFHYDGKLVFSRNIYDTFIDNKQGGEGYTFSGDIDGVFSAFRLVAEKNFIISYTNDDKYKPSLLGYQYEIENYKVN